MSESLGQRIRRLREAQGRTVVDVARAVGAAEGTLRQIESGHIKTPGLLVGLRIANTLNVDPFELALGDGASTTERFEALERRLAKIEARLAQESPRR